MRASWVAHLCGLCLALRDGHGQLARAATNYDGLIVSVLVEAQSRRPAGEHGRRTAGPCPLRGMRTASVATGEGARLAAAVSLTLASAKIRDHIVDGDGAFARRPVASVGRGLVRRWDTAGARTRAGLGFDTAVLLDAVGRQSGTEATVGPDTPLLAVTEPTETATAAAFGHTAVLVGRLENRAPLEEAGRLFGRLAHLLDAVEDLAVDTEAGAWNPLTATGTSLHQARRLCDDAAHGIRLALRDVEFTDGALVHALLGHEPGRAVDRAFGATCGHAPAPPEPPGQRRGLLTGCAVWSALFCTCQICCADPYHDPWTGQSRKGCLRDCDDFCDCLDCCDCCDCLRGCNCGGDGGGGVDGDDGGCLDCCDCDCGCDC